MYTMNTTTASTIYLCRTSLYSGNATANTTPAYTTIWFDDHEPEPDYDSDALYVLLSQGGDV